MPVRNPAQLAQKIPPQAASAAYREQMARANKGEEQIPSSKLSQ